MHTPVPHRHLAYFRTENIPVMLQRDPARERYAEPTSDSFSVLEVEMRAGTPGTPLPLNLRSPGGVLFLFFGFFFAYTYFLDRESEVQRGEVDCSRSHS